MSKDLDKWKIQPSGYRFGIDYGFAGSDKTVVITKARADGKSEYITDVSFDSRMEIKRIEERAREALYDCLMVHMIMV